MSCSDTDLLIDEQGDLVFGADDAEAATAPMTIAQNIIERLRFAPGSLPWARGEGADIARRLNAAVADPGLDAAIVRRAALAEPCVDANTVSVVQADDGEWTLTFATLDGDRAVVRVT